MLREIDITKIDHIGRLGREDEQGERRGGARPALPQRRPRNRLSQIAPAGRLRIGEWTCDPAISSMSLTSWR
jgi:hypothetical protein